MRMIRMRGERSVMMMAASFEAVLMNDKAILE